MGAAVAETASRIGVNPYGYFDASACEYVITRPDTPTPWINYLGEGRFGGIVSNTGGGYAFDRDPRHARVSRYRYNAVPIDQPGRYVYLRDQESGEFWSATWQPVKRPLEAYECRHGAGYTRIAARCAGIASELLYFVPPASGGDDWRCELWVLRIRNGCDRTRRLRTFSYVELSFADAVADQQNLDWAQHIVRSRYADGVILAGTVFRPQRTFFASNAEPSGHDSDRETFVGRWRDLACPAVVERGESTCTGSPRGNSIGSLSHDLELLPGEEREIVFVLGVADDEAGIDRAVAAFRDPARVAAAFDGLRADWDGYRSHLSVETPDPELDAMVNVWNQIQCRTTLHWSRFVSAYETGLGRGMGIRDSAQDTLGTVHAVPERVRATLTRLWRLQFRDGHTWHQFFPLTGEGSPGLAAELPDRPQWFSDDHLWLVIAVCAYLRETGDLLYLDEPVAYADGGEETVWEHMLRAIRFTLDHRGPHGLPRAGFSDWNDTLNVDRGSGRAESVWCGMQFCRAALDLAELAAEAGRGEEAGRLRTHAREMSAAVNEHAWDGEWYARAFDDDGRPIGVASRGTAPDQHEPPVVVRDRRRRAGGAGRACAPLDGRPPRDRVRHRPPLAAVRRRRPARPRTLHLPPRREGERRHLLPRERVGDRRRRDARLERPGVRLLPDDPPAQTHRFGPVHGRALRVLPEHLRAGAPAVRPRPERLADRRRRVDVRRRDAVDPRDQADLRGPASLPGPARRVGRLHGEAGLPRRRVRDRRRAPRRRRRGRADRRRQPRRGRRRPGRPGRRARARRGEGRLVSGPPAGAFPPDFVWGAATASYQIEGAVDAGGRGESIWDRFCATPGKVWNGNDGSIACDFYHRYRDDVALMRELGIDAFRFSIAWPRILPEGSGRPNAAGLDFYDRLVDELLASGIAPYPTLYHWDLPQALQDRGGWPARETAEAFAGYVEHVVARLGDRVRRWVTHNEPWVVAWLGHGWGRHAPGLSSRPAALAAGHHVLLSHGLALEAIRREAPAAEVGIVLDVVPAYPATDSPADRAAAAEVDGFHNRWFLDPLFRGSYPADVLESFAPDAPPVEDGDLGLISARIDFLGVNNYTREIVRASPDGGRPARVYAEHARHTAMGWEVYPDGLRDLLLRIHADYGPQAVYVMENGAAFGDVREHDGKRARPRALRVPGGAHRRRRQRDLGGSARQGLLRLVAARQPRVGGRILEAVRPRLRRLPDARTGPEGQLRPVPGPHPGAARAGGGERNGRTGLSRSARRPASGAVCRRPASPPAAPGFEPAGPGPPARSCRFPPTAGSSSGWGA